MSVTFRSSVPTSTAPMSDGSDYIPNEHGVSEDVADIEPVTDTDGSTVMGLLGLNDALDNLPPEEKQSLADIERYIADSLSKKGVDPTKEAFRKSLDNLKTEVGLDVDASPETALERISGVIQAWRDLGFIKDPQAKKSLFMKLAKAESSSEMNKIVFNEMEKYQVWQ